MWSKFFRYWTGINGSRNTGRTQDRRAYSNLGAGQQSGAALLECPVLARPQYVYNLDQQEGAPAPAAAQYIVQKLNLADVHRMVRGTHMPDRGDRLGDRRRPNPISRAR
jgi:hypothetical protein